MVGVPTNYRAEYSDCKVHHMMVRKRHMQSASHDWRPQAPPTLLSCSFGCGTSCVSVRSCSTLQHIQLLQYFAVLTSSRIDFKKCLVTDSPGKIQSRTCAHALQTMKYCAALVSCSCHVLWELSMNQLGKKRVWAE